MRRRFVNDTVLLRQSPAIKSMKGNLCGIRGLRGMAKLIFGCGYLGTRIAQAWLAVGHEVYAVTRRAPRAVEFAKQGIRPLMGDLTESLKLPAMPALDTVLFAVGYDRTTDKTIREVYVLGLRNALRALPDSVQRFIYISSTGVYGQSAGELVDEDAPCEPRRAGGRACLEAEQLLADDRLGDRSIILRCGGLYGPGRIPKLEALRAGQILTVASSGFLNLLHVDDAVRIVLAAEDRARPPCRYVVADGHPVPRREFYREAARLLDMAPPQFREPPRDAATTDRSITSKRLVTTRMRRALRIELLYPTYREGLRAIVRQPAPPAPSDDAPTNADSPGGENREP